MTTRPIRTAAQMLAESKARIVEKTPREVMALKAAGRPVVYLDCREPNEWNLGRLPGAIHIPRGQLETNVEARIPRDEMVVIYCASGNRSAFAAETMQQMGYQDVCSMSGGIRGWMEAGGDVEG
jgi:rhodanese-related sulfurtransferase